MSASSTKKFEPSEAARREGVCCTRAEADAFYKALSKETKAPALEMLRKELAPVREVVVAKIKINPQHWCSAYHFMWGMSVRNLLREKGFGEAHFDSHNLDCIYIALIEEALLTK